MSEMNRREFLKTAAVSSAALAIASPVLVAAENGSSNAPQLPRRVYKPGIELSVIAFPAIMLRTPLADQEKANRVVGKAVERGCNYFDVAPAYGDAQQKLGPALQPYRKNVFLSCKTKRRDAAGAKAELNNSLGLLRTDHFDLYQLHAIIDVKKDVDAAFAKGGAMETILEAKKAGVIRHIGFTAHTAEAALAALDRFEFDSIMFPLNFASIMKGNFGQDILDTAKKKNCTRITIKSFCRQEWPSGANRGQFRQLWYEPLFDRHEAELGLRWTMSQEITTTIPPGDENVFNLACELAMNLKPMTAAETEELKALAMKLSPLFRAGRVTG